MNTGDQVYSGTIAGSAPVMIHDDQFRFEVNLITGEETGKVYLFNHIAGPKVRCTLTGVGTGVNGDGNPTFNYSGTCTFPRSLARPDRADGGVLAYAAPHGPKRRGENKSMGCLVASSIARSVRISPTTLANL